MKNNKKLLIPNEKEKTKTGKIKIFAEFDRYLAVRIINKY
jgi:hypothetical protein